jgi:hypothetical protein
MKTGMSWDRIPETKKELTACQLLIIFGVPNEGSFDNAQDKCTPVVLGQDTKSRKGVS